MPKRHVKYTCSSAQCLRRGHDGRKLTRAFYALNRKQVERAYEAPDEFCPLCGDVLTPSRLQTSVPDTGVLLHSALAERRADPERTRLGKQRIREAARRRRRRSLPVSDDSDDSDDDTEEYSAEEHDPVGDADEDFEPATNFSPHLRLTTGKPRPEPRQKVPAEKQYFQSQGPFRIGKARGRGLDANAVMGRKILRQGHLSAWRHGFWPPFKANPQKSAEWAHLIADCLGGKTTPNNLVAASYSCNTEMLAIETLLKGKTGLKVKVEASCSSPYVAELIRYEVSNSSRRQPAQWVHWIDARNEHFTRSDLNALRANLKAWLHKQGVR